MPRQRSLEAVVDDIYEAAAEPTLWSHALDGIGDHFDGSPLVIWLQEIPRRPHFIAISRLNPALVQLFFERYTTPETNPAIPHLLRATPGVPFDFVANIGGASAFRRTPMYADLFVPDRIEGRGCATIFHENGVVAPMVLPGRVGCAPLTSVEEGELAFLLRHIKRSLRVTARLLRMEAVTTPFIAALNRVDLAVLFADATGRITFVNGAAERILAAQDGLAIKSGRLVAQSRAESALLDRLITAASSPQRRGGGTLGISRPSGAARYGIEVSHVPLQSLVDQPLSGAVIFITDPTARPRRSDDLLLQTFGLTPAELRVAVAVAQGNRIGVAAEVLGVSTNTVKTLLQRVFAKTDTRRQSELAALVASLARPGPAAGSD